MELTIKTFQELTTKELYEILKVRGAIFVVEQSCVYQDIDGLDEASLHLFYEAGGQVQAYLRAFEKEPGIVQMGRVLTLRHGEGLGGRLLHEGISMIKRHFHPEKIVIEAQCYATGYYEKAGFQRCSEEFLEDGIPHVRMELTL
ncbi:GNAT family N-acetyltransferase [Enterococcus asini]|uniref:GNAT family N-acetyltransferase n=1 Tax=Enterococcus asini TaxID=57732 RepID=UPI00266D9889|nr:GNAT family N-acetyltransferase [Enterococcus asini]